MKLFKRSNTYKASNVKFLVDENAAYSYDWWCFFKTINGKNVFNSYYYSPSTCGHQSKVRSLLNDLNIKIDMEVCCPAGLHVNDTSMSASEYYSNEITKLKAAIAKPRSQAKKNAERLKEIDKLAKICVDFKLLTEGGA